MTLKLLLLLVIASLAYSSPVKKASKPATCSACHPTVQGKTNVHLVPHSHDDVGWLKTVDQYYYGSHVHNTYEGAGVQYIISAAIDALQNHPDRRYIQVETAYFWQWWLNQSDEIKALVRTLTDSGRLEFINGAWSMNDEAAAHYHSIIDQYTWGFRRLNDTLGECARPKFSWQIDPFGHSREQASLLNQMGFSGLLVGRLDYRDKNHRIETQNLDFLWKTSDSLDNANFYTTTYPNGYTYEPNFCFDVTCDDIPIYDDPNSPDYNLPSKMEELSSLIDNYKNWYKTSNLLIPMGGDFTYQAAEINYSNSDKLIKAFKNHPKYNVIYSTPNCYARAVNEEMNANNVKLAIKKDDFFPYASGPHSYWTGYFSSRPTSKRYERLANNILQSAKQLAAMSKAAGTDLDEDLVLLRQAMGIMQHHDAITGTETQQVADDYARILSLGIDKVQPVLDTIETLLQKDPNKAPNLNLSLCLLSNVSICEKSGRDRFLVAVQNPVSRNVSHYVRLPVEGTNYNIVGSDGSVDYDIFDAISDFSWITGEQAPSSKELVFRAEDVPPLGVKVYYVEKMAGAGDKYKPFAKLDKDVVLGSKLNQVSINSLGRVTSMMVDGKEMEVTQDFMYYLGVSADNSAGDDSRRSSGAYIFRPIQQEATPITLELRETKISRGVLVDEVLQVYSDQVCQIIRVYKSDKDKYVEFDWLIGNLQFTANNTGVEIVARYGTTMTNSATFYTDSNGREQIRRELNKRPDYEYPIEDEPVAANYYPVTAKIALKEGANEFSVLNDRAQGGSSLQEGHVELLVHRRLAHDDAFGVGEALNEVQYDLGLFARGQHWLTFGSTAFARDLALRKRLAPLVLVADASDGLEAVQELINLSFEGLRRSLPENVAILTLEPWKEDTFILRLEHIMEEGEDEVMSQPATVNLEGLFTTFSINDIGETTLGANQWLADFEEEEKFVWNANGIVFRKSRRLADNPLEVTLKPMEIRTFIIKVAKN